MRSVRSKNTKRISVLLAAVLLIAQAGALTHAYEHDPASVQYQFCATCIAGHAVGSACVDATPQFDTPADKSPTRAKQVSAQTSVALPRARQRAPPSSL